MTRWLDPHPVNIPASFADLGLPPFIEQILLRHGISSPEEVEAFLHSDLIPSMPFPNIEAAVGQTQRAIHDKELIYVWGDFDVDGRTSTKMAQN